MLCDWIRECVVGTQHSRVVQYNVELIPTNHSNPQLVKDSSTDQARNSASAKTTRRSDPTLNASASDVEDSSEDNLISNLDCDVEDNASLLSTSTTQSEESVTESTCDTSLPVDAE